MELNSECKTRKFLNACRIGDLDTVKELCENKEVDPHVDDELALLYAIEGGHFNVVIYLVEGQNANINVFNGEPIRWAIDNNKFEIARYLKSMKNKKRPVKNKNHIFTIGRFIIGYSFADNWIWVLTTNKEIRYKIFSIEIVKQKELKLKVISIVLFPISIVIGLSK